MVFTEVLAYLRIYVRLARLVVVIVLLASCESARSRPSVAINVLVTYLGDLRF